MSGRSRHCVLRLRLTKLVGLGTAQHFPPDYDDVVKQRRKAPRVVAAAIAGVFWVLGSHFLLSAGWGLALVEGLLFGLGQFLVTRYMRSGAGNRSDQ